MRPKIDILPSCVMAMDLGNGYMNTTGVKKVFDRSQYHNHGTVIGALPRYPGFKFDGIDDYINCGNDESLDLTTAITISAWIYPKAYEKYILSKNNLSSLDHQYAIFLQPNDHKIVYYPTNGLGSATDSISLNVWTHITLTRNSAGIGQFYINGVASGNPLAISMPTRPTFPVRLGCRWNNGNPHSSYMFNGSIADVRIYSRALIQEEITLLYESYRPKLLIE